MVAVADVDYLGLDIPPQHQSTTAQVDVLIRASDADALDHLFSRYPALLPDLPGAFAVAEAISEGRMVDLPALSPLPAAARHDPDSSGRLSANAVVAPAIYGLDWELHNRSGGGVHVGGARRDGHKLPRCEQCVTPQAAHCNGRERRWLFQCGHDAVRRVGGTQPRAPDVVGVVR